MNLFEWLASLVALIWLVIVSIFDIRERKVPHLLWTAIPFLLAAVYHLFSGHVQMIVLAAALMVAASERRQLKNRAVEWILMIVVVFVIIWLLVTQETSVVIGIVGIFIFWLSWEIHCIGGADAMALITCVLLWPGAAFLVAYLIAGLTWSLGVRLKEGGWRRGHWVPGLAIVATAAVIYLADFAFLQFIPR
jgi:Flp pilus assembly protein protease CpaA